jgi:hypothetical protein
MANESGKHGGVASDLVKSSPIAAGGLRIDVDLLDTCESFGDTRIIEDSIVQPGSR